MRNLTPFELKALLEKGGFTLLDVRMPEEVAIASLPGAMAIPLAELPARCTEIPRDKPVVAFCHHGVRSASAGHFLERSGFKDVSHLSGGIDAWSQLIDPAVPRY
jgi:rhodanese-related sulfurtransferase